MNRYIKMIICALLLFSGSIPGFGQNDADMQPHNVPLHSPNVASLGAYGEIPVSNYTGVPSIDIPIYEIDLDGMTIPISMSYHGSGVRVQQEASWVGLNWSLNAGGQIMKTIRGEEDHQVTWQEDGLVRGYYEAKPLFSHYIDGSMYPNVPITGNIPVDQVACSEFINMMLESDTEPDLYSYNFCGHTGKMITGAEEYQPAGHGDVKKGLLISPKEYVDFSFKDGSWVAQDVRGYKYYFRTFETTSTESSAGMATLPSMFLSAEGSMTSHEVMKRNIRNQGNGSSFVSAWLLDSIVSPRNNKVSFEYRSEFIETPMNLTEYGNYLTTINGAIMGEIPVPDVYPHQNYIVSYSTISQTMLTKITWDGGQIIFDTTDRNDLISAQAGKAKKLSAIKVYNKNGIQIRDFALEHAYHGSTHTSYPEYRQRLLLTKVTENKSNAKHSFSYNMGELPAKHSLNTDLWGYYNGSKGVPSQSSSIYKLYTVPSARLQNNITGSYLTITGANKDSDPASLLHGMLQSVTYPTGGQTQLEFEPHQIKETTVQPNPGGYLYYDYVYVAGISSNPSIQDVPELYFPFELDQSCTRGKLSFDHYQIDLQDLPDFDLYESDVTVSIQRLENGEYVNVPFTITPFSNQITTFYPEISMDQQIRRYDLNFHWQSGKYRFVFHRDEYFRTNFAFSVVLNIYMGIKGPDETQEESTTVGGLRIKKVTNVTGDKQEVTEYKYLTQDGSKSSGLLMSTPFYNAKVIQRVEHNASIQSYRMERIYDRFSTNPFTELSYSAQGSHVGYDDVQVYKYGQDGYVNYSYNNGPGGSSSVGQIRIPMVDSGFNGLLKKASYYNANSELVKTEECTYDYFMEDKAYYAIAKDLEYLRGSDFWSPVDLRSGAVCYRIPSFITQLRESKTTEYFSGNNNLQQITTHDYDGNYLLPISTETISSKGENAKEITKYPFNYTDATHIGMVSKGLVGIPIERISLRNNHVVAGNKVQYKDTLGMYLPVKTFAFEATTPANLGNYQSGYKEDVQLSNFNRKGKMGMARQNDYNTVYLWSYNGMYPVAEIRNASYGEVKDAASAIGLNLDNLLTSFNPSMSQLNQLRGALGEAFVTTYLYNPLVGVTRKTDPDEKVTYYDYDTFGRLKEIYLIKEGLKEILESYQYHYANQ